jgi:signal transduction histidine kinase
MLIVLVAAIVPLGVIGAWLTASSARSGRALLQADLDSSLAQVTRRMAARWQYRAADLRLLAGNEAARQLLSQRQLPADTASARYLRELARVLRPSIDEFSYRDRTGRVLWSSSELTSDVFGPQAESRRVVGFYVNDAVVVRRDVVSDAGERLGVLEARVLLSSMLPTDSLQSIVAAAALRIVNRATGAELGGTPLDGDGSRERLVSAAASLEDPPIDIELAASAARYVEPFARAARIGILLLLAVSVVAIGLTAFLSRRLTASFAHLVDATSAVAAGDLGQTVHASGSPEIVRLAAAFNTMTESLRRTVDELARREALAAVGQFAASISHEVRNALTAVRLDLQRLQERAASSETDRALIGRLLHNVHRLDSIVTGSLRVARTNPETMRPVAVAGVLHGAVAAAEPVLLETGCRVETVPSSDDASRLRVKGDAAALEQMFLNLLINAAHAMRPGGVAQVAIGAAADVVTVSIADTGHGMAPADLERLGKPFFSSKPTGTGLGFPIARQIATAHGGNVRVVSTGPTGTTVSVTLPRWTQDPAGQSIGREVAQTVR